MRALSTFTVAELDALPVGSRFICFLTLTDEGHRYTFTRFADGMWRWPMHTNLSGFSSAAMLAHWCVGDSDDYHLDTDPRDLELTQLRARILELETALAEWGER